MQVLLVVIAASLLMLAGYSLGRVSGYSSGRRAHELGPPRRPSNIETVVLVGVGLVALGGALAVQGTGIRIPTPARLDELTGRAERVAVARAEELAGTPDP